MRWPRPLARSRNLLGGSARQAQSRAVDDVGEADCVDSLMEDGVPLPRLAAARAVVRCVAVAAILLARRRVHLLHRNNGLQIGFFDGTAARVYRETVVDGAAATARCVLMVSFRLRAVHGRGHQLFQAESILNTPLFVGFPGFVSKLWLAADSREVYRGFYDWDQPRLAAAYARALWRVLALVSVPGSIHYRVLPRVTRAAVLADPDAASPDDPEGASAWWRVTGSTRPEEPGCACSAPHRVRG